MTAAEVKTPPVPPAALAAPASAAWRLAAGARLAWLHLRSRRVPSALLALAVCGGVLRAVLHWHLTSGGANSQQVPMIIAAGGLLAWTLPLGYLGFAEYALINAWRSPWTWPARPPADRGAWICAALVFAVGLAAATLRGARTSLADNG